MTATQQIRIGYVHSDHTHSQCVWLGKNSGVIHYENGP